jgi:hypothetical protein
MDIDQIADELIEVKLKLESLSSNYFGLDVDPLFYESLNSINLILEEIE